MKKIYMNGTNATEILRMNIGGVQQGMIIGIAGPDRPVILHIHGGPGMPDYSLFHEYGLNLQDDYNICWWEQRGAGISNDPDTSIFSLTLEQLIADTLEVTNYLRERFHQEKIYLMAHSWGSFLAVNVINRYPELYAAYLGIGQIAHQVESEIKCVQYLARYAQAFDNSAMLESVDRFQQMPPEEMAVNIEYLIFRTDALNALGAGCCHSSEWVHGDHDPLESCREYEPEDIAANKAGLVPSVTMLWPSLIGPDLKKMIPRLEVPVYLIHGAYDKQVDYDLTWEYFEALDAPGKKFFTFANSAHYPHLEEKDKFLEVVHQLLF